MNKVPGMNIINKFADSLGMPAVNLNIFTMILAVMNAVYAFAYIKPEKVRTSMGFEPLTSQYWWDDETTAIGSWSFVGPREPVRNDCEVIYEIFHILM